MTKNEIIKAAANKLMGWKLPENFYPDCYISFDSAKAKGMHSWPTGTNLFHVGQAVEMLEYCLSEYLAAPEQSEPVAEIGLDSNGDMVTQWNPEFNPSVGTKLYTAAPQPTELSDAEIDEVWMRCPQGGPHMRDQLRCFARAVLAAQKAKT